MSTSGFATSHNNLINNHQPYKRDSNKERNIDTYPSGDHDPLLFLAAGAEELFGGVFILPNMNSVTMIKKEAILSMTRLFERIILPFLIITMANVTYINQPAIGKSHGKIPLAGTSHIYTVNKVLWPKSIEYFLETLLKNIFQPSQYKFQYKFENGDIVDAVIFVKDKILPIDAKFSLENFTFNNGISR